MTNATGYFGTRDRKITAMNMSEFERIFESKKFARYSGVAPFKHTSGTSVRGKCFSLFFAGEIDPEISHQAQYRNQRSNSMVSPTLKDRSSPFTLGLGSGRWGLSAF